MILNICTRRVYPLVRLDRRYMAVTSKEKIARELYYAQYPNEDWDSERTYIKKHFLSRADGQMNRCETHGVENCKSCGVL